MGTSYIVKIYMNLITVKDLGVLFFYYINILLFVLSRE